MSRETDDARVLRRLLQALNEPGACAARNCLDDDGALIVRASKNGVTIVRARVDARTGDAAVSGGLAAWSSGAAPRLSITEAGRAWLRRAAAPKGADPFQAQHAEYVTQTLGKCSGSVRVNAAESPLAWLARRKDRDGRAFLGPAQIEAGERLRRDLGQAQLLQRVTANWEVSLASARRGASAGVAVSEVAMDARRRLDRAFGAVGPELAGLLIDVCGYLKGLETVERERGWPARSGKLLLRLALDSLARHYGVGAEAKGRLAPKACGIGEWRITGRDCEPTTRTAPEPLFMT